MFFYHCHEGNIVLTWQWDEGILRRLWVVPNNAWIKGSHKINTRVKLWSNASQIATRTSLHHICKKNIMTRAHGGVTTRAIHWNRQVLPSCNEICICNMARRHHPTILWKILVRSGSDTIKSVSIRDLDISPKKLWVKVQLAIIKNRYQSPTCNF